MNISRLSPFPSSRGPLRALAALVPMLCGLAGCKTQVQCREYELTLCGNDPVKVVACGKKTVENVLQVQDVQLSVANPPGYLDVSPANQSSFPYFPPYVPLDSSLQVSVTGNELGPGGNRPGLDSKSFDSKIVPEAYGTTVGGVYDAVGWIKSSTDGNSVATGTLVAPRVVVTAAHALLPAGQGYGTDLSQVVYTFTTNLTPSGSSNSQGTTFNPGGNKSDVGWAFIHPAYDAQTRANDIAIVVLQNGITLSSAQAYASLNAQTTPEALDSCSCPVNPVEAVVVGWGEGGGHDGDVPPAVPETLGGYDFPIAAGTQRNLAIVQLEALDELKDSIGLGAPSIDFLSTALYEGDKGAPVFLGQAPTPVCGSNGTCTAASMPLFAVYSSPSSVISREATRVTPAITSWIEGTMLNTNASYPPINWNGLGDQSGNGAYAFTAPDGWSATPQIVVRHAEDIVPQSGGASTSTSAVLSPSSYLTCGSPAATTPTKVALADIPKMIILGDSLSDQQNQWNFNTSNQTPNPAAGYWNGRFTNGYNWVDYFEIANGRQNTGFVINAAVGGAFAGALGQQVATDFFGGSIAAGVRPTIATELAAISASDQDRSLAIIWAGPNDVNEAVLSMLKQNKNIASFSPTPAALALNIISAVKAAANTLYGNGAEKVIIANMPQLDTTPQATDPALGSAAGYYGSLGQVYARNVVNTVNSQLAAWVASQNANGFPDITTVDIAAFLNGWTGGTPSSVNMYQVTRACRNTDSANIFGLPGSIPIIGTTYKDEPCRGYLFFDPLHPTTLSHCGVSQLFQTTMWSTLAITLPAGLPGAFETFCPRQVQNAPWTNFPTARPAAFYTEVPAGSAVTAPAACPTACPTGYPWLSPDMNTNNTNVPSWFDIPAIPGGTVAAGTTQGQMLAPGWNQTGQPAGTVGACFCQQ